VKCLPDEVSWLSFLSFILMNFPQPILPSGMGLMLDAHMGDVLSLLYDRILIRRGDESNL
jgi:hypothetical protein